jgi:hypothetical protein
MKNFLHGCASNLLRFSLVAGILCLTERIDAQDNVWTGAASGNWQDATWSLGSLPATNQTIWVTNYGWKAVQIGADTAQHFAPSLNVNAINISSPTNSFNTLLLNDAGSVTPLTVKTLTVASNSAVQLFSSALQINGPSGSGMMVGGLVEQNDSVVAGNQVNVGYIGSGIYNFNSGYLTVSQLWLGGGATPGVFNQNGGTNGFGITHLDGGTYVLSNGWYGATIYFDTFGQFLQEGGWLANDLALFNGSYVLAGGVHQGGAAVPSQNGFTGGNASMWQTGGTNYGSFDIGSQGYGTYTMSNGVSDAANFSIGHSGSYFQAGGIQAVTGTISIDEQQVNFEAYEGGSFNLNDGQISASGLYSKGYYNQTGGTNVVSGDITIAGLEDTSLAIFGGLLAANNLSVSPGFVGGVSVSGGTLLITNTLSVGGSGYFPEWHGFAGGGELVVSNISLAPDAIFSCGNGVIKQSGTFTLANANVYSGTNSVQLGALCLASGGNTNSTLYLVSPTSIVNFANSSSVTWSNEPMLNIEGWSGSLSGGGAQQIIFGKDASALTSAQLAHIQFHNPAGLTNGMYPARILFNGELVPSVAAALPASMALQRQPGGMQVTLQGEAGRTYLIETSTDMVHWAPWTNVVNATGTMNVTDTATANCPARFYRAHLMP